MIHAHIESIAKQLPPSASTLELLDVGGQCGQALQGLRPDVRVTIASLRVETWQWQQTFDAVVAYDYALTPDFLARVLACLRYGGRLIVLNPLQSMDVVWGKQLEQAHYVRILVESTDDQQALLIRGERAHAQHNTVARVQIGAQYDADTLDWAQYQGRFVHMLVRQTPNKPAWKMTPDDALTWHSVMANGSVLAFTSLPKAVNFMQRAVLQNRVQDVNKVAKFRKETAQAWTFGILLNPTLETLGEVAFAWQLLDHTTAEKPDE
jgi:acyl-CoA synthetase (AMP-forming)/AMP-acid ligase II